MALFVLNKTVLQGITRHFTPARLIRQLPKLGLEGTQVNKAPQVFKRSLWHLSNNSTKNGNKLLIPKYCTVCKLNKCCCCKVHTKGDQELVQFLTEEIDAETKAQKHPKLPTIEGFDVKPDGSFVVLTKTFQNEKIKVKLNVNHTVDTDEADGNPAESTPPAQAAPSEDKMAMAEMKSKPSFTVEIEKGNKTIGFSCSFVQDYAPEEADDPDAFNDIFNIDEVVFHDGKWSENTYSVSGEIIDGYLYDLLMNTLEERGISSEFVEKLSEFCTSYEHKLYINLLENLKSFISAGK